MTSQNKYGSQVNSQLCWKRIWLPSQGICYKVLFPIQASTILRLSFSPEYTSNSSLTLATNMICKPDIWVPFPSRAFHHLQGNIQTPSMTARLLVTWFFAVCGSSLTLQDFCKDYMPQEQQHTESFWALLFFSAFPTPMTGWLLSNQARSSFSKNASLASLL